MKGNTAPAKEKSKAERDRLMGELIGLSKAVCGNMDEERFVPDTDTHRAMLEALSAVAELPEKLGGEAPDEPDIRSLKGEILANVKKAAPPALSALKSGVVRDEIFAEFYRALYAVGIFFDREKLKTARKQSEELLKSCIKLEAEGRQKTADERFMREAIRQAVKAEAIGEVPIGCVIVRNGQIISRGYNRRTTDKNVLAHAEIMAIHRACRKLGDWRLSDCTLYVTLEPCPMCAGAMVQSRLDRCVIGSMSDKSGCAGSVVDLLQEKGFNHQVKTVSGVLGAECSEILSRFFSRMRKNGQQTEKGR